MSAQAPERNIGLFAATFVGIGAIVGGGIFVLGGVAIRESGSGALLAFAINGCIAFLTVLSFAELSTLFPDSGGSYTYAKKILSVRAAFSMGWLLWFAHIVTCLLYALGFAAYGHEAILRLSMELGVAAPPWLASKPVELGLAALAIAFYTRSLLRQVGAGGNWANYFKLTIFAVLIIGGCYALSKDSAVASSRTFPPMLPQGIAGLLSAMGFTFIALQGFDLIGAIAGEIKTPLRVIPKAMTASLAIALAIYLPLLFITSTVGLPAGEDLQRWCGRNPEVCFAEAAENYMGGVGYWLVVIAAIFSTLSALSANLLAASRIAFTMAEDRTLPRSLAKVKSERAIPVSAIQANAAALLLLLLVVTEVSVAGAAASLVFLMTFGFCHATSYLARMRIPKSRSAFRAPLFPLVPVVGGLSCVGLALFQCVQVPIAGVILLCWLALGVFVYFARFAQRAEALDAYREMHEPALMESRGLVPLVLVPIANPKAAGGLMSVAHTLASPEYGHVLLLNVVPRISGEDEHRYDQAVENAADVLKAALLTSLSRSVRPPEAMLTIAEDPWQEIERVAALHRCSTVLLGFSNLSEHFDRNRLERLMNQVRGDAVLLSAPHGWQLRDVRRVLLPVAGGSPFDALRARILGSLIRLGAEQIRYLSLQRKNSTDKELAAAESSLLSRAQDEARGYAYVDVRRTAAVAEAIVDAAEAADLLILGLNRSGQGDIRFGPVAEHIARHSPCPTLIIGHRRRRR